MEAINWDAVAALSEAFGVIAVVMSLIFVGLQIRQGTNAAKIEAVRNTSSEWRGVYEGVASDSRLADVMYRGVNDYKKLDGAELMQFNAAIHSFFHVAASTFYQYENGALDQGTFDGIFRQLRQIIGLPGIKEYWASRKEIFSEQSQAYFDKEIYSQPSDEIRQLSKDGLGEATDAQS